MFHILSERDEKRNKVMDWRVGMLRKTNHNSPPSLFRVTVAQHHALKPRALNELYIYSCLLPPHVSMLGTKAALNIHK